MAINLIFTNNFTIFAQIKEELERMPGEIHNVAKQIGLEMNVNKTKYMTNDRNNKNNVYIIGQKIEKVVHISRTNNNIK